MARERTKLRPVTNLSQAFYDKSEHELKILRTAVATTLKDDMLRLVDEESFADLELTNGTDSIKVHQCIFRSRVRECWSDEWISASDNGDKILMKGLSGTQVQSFARQLYSVSDAKLLLQEFLPFLESTARTDQWDLNVQENETIVPSYETSIKTLCDSVENHMPPNDKEGYDKEITNARLSGAFTIQNAPASGEKVEGHEDLNRVGGDKGSVRSVNECLKFVSEDQAGDKNSLTDVQQLTCNAFYSIEKESTQGGQNGDKCLFSSSPQTFDCQSDSSIDKSYNICSPLGKDLLFLYLSQYKPDCFLAVGSQKFPAHKCIISARSHYFSAMLSGHWSESQSKTVTLEGVSPHAVEQLLLFLYGGVLILPDYGSSASTSLVDLFMIADMYGVSSLNKVLTFYLRRDLCHFFHKPCQVCTVSAADALSLSHTFHLDDIEQRCLKWIAKYFHKIWPSRTFANLHESVQQLSLKSIKEQLTPATVLDIIVECNRLTVSLPRVKWTEGILCLLTQLMDAAIEYTSSNFVRVIQSPNFLQWAQIANWKAGALVEIFASVIDSLPIDKACYVFQALLDLQTLQTTNTTEGINGEVGDIGEGVREEVVELLDMMIKRCERFMRTHTHQVMRSQQWLKLPIHVQARIKDSSSYLSLDDFPDFKPRPRVQNTRVSKASLQQRQRPPRVGSMPSSNNQRAGMLRPGLQRSVSGQNSGASSVPLNDSQAHNQDRRRQQISQRSNYRESSNDSRGATPSSSLRNDKTKKQLTAQSRKSVNKQTSMEQDTAEGNADLEDQSNDSYLDIHVSKTDGDTEDSNTVPSEAGDFIHRDHVPLVFRAYSNEPCNVDPDKSLVTPEVTAAEDGIENGASDTPCNSYVEKPESFSNLTQNPGPSSNVFLNSVKNKEIYGNITKSHGGSRSRDSSPRNLSSKLPVAASSSLVSSTRRSHSSGLEDSKSRSPKQRWSTDADSHFSESLQRGGESSLSVSVPASTTQSNNSGSVMADDSSSYAELPKAEVKVVKMSRPLSIGFVVPPN